MLLDLHLLQVSGFRLMQLLKQRPDTPRIPVIVITALSFREVEEAIRAGADDFVTKPFLPAEVVTRVDRLARAHGVAGAPGLLTAACGQLTARVLIARDHGEHPFRQKWAAKHGHHRPRSRGASRAPHGGLWSGQSDASLALNARLKRRWIQRRPHPPVPANQRRLRVQAPTQKRGRRVGRASGGPACPAHAAGGWPLSSR